MGHHPVVGSHRGALDVPRPVEHLERFGQGEAVLGLVDATPGLKDGRLKRDLAGRDRYVLATRVGDGAD